MIRLTVMYNLPDGADEDEFIDWRVTAHQETNESMPGVVRTDFGRITDSWPARTPEYAFQTTVEWPDRASFESGFHDVAVQAKLRENLTKLGDYLFTVSEVLVASEP